MAKDIIHDAVKNALLKDNWTVTHAPYIIRVKGVQMYADLGAEKVIAAEKDGQKIVVEIKSFMGDSAISEFHTAVGQYLNYQQALEEQDPIRQLYLAISDDVYDSFFTIPFVQEAVVRHKIKLIICNIQQEVIIKWKI